MDILKALLIGIVQGLTEFLPVSSSGHILIAEKLLNVQLESSNDLMLVSVAMHLGTLLAVVIIYRKQLLEMLRDPLGSDLKWLVVATIPAVAAALLIDFGDAFEGAFLGWSFLVTSAILIAGETINKHLRQAGHLHRHIHLRDALVMGIMQAVAILPGVSRSGSTIAGGSANGLSKRRAADFAFLMSIPAILGSAVLEAKDIFTGGISSAIDAKALVAGAVASFAAGFLTISSMQKILKKKNSLIYFAVYTALLGGFVLADKFFLHFIF